MQLHRLIQGIVRKGFRKEYSLFNQHKLGIAISFTGNIPFTSI